MAMVQNVDTDELDKAIEKSGLRISHIVEQIGISRQAFDKKRKGLNKFRKSEVYVICDLLRLDEAGKNRIFLP